MSNDPMWPDPNRTPADSETARADANAEMYANATYERVRVVYDIDIITTTDGGWQGLARVLHPSDGLRTKNATFVECLKWCDDCEQWERPRSCEHCQGSGYGGPLIQSMDNIQGWTECEWCAGVGRAHVEYTLSGTSAAKADLAAARAELAEARRKLAEVGPAIVAALTSGRVGGIDTSGLSDTIAVYRDEAEAVAQEVATALAAVGSGDTEPATAHTAPAVGETKDGQR